jgi:phosphate transport system permease protein
MNLRKLEGTIMMMICGAAALCAAGILILILAIIFMKGAASLTPHFILFSESNSGMGFGTGIANAIAGTILLALTSTILAIPFGVGTAIYLQRYAPDNPFTRFLRLMIEVLSGTPSIVLGIVALFLLVVYLRPITGGESLFAGSIALGALVIPVIERATEDAIARVPRELEEGSYALGATKWLTIRDIIIPSAFSGITVGAILGFGRAAEESAVVLLTAGYSQFMPQFRIALNPQFLLGIKIYPLNDLLGTLPVFLYTSYENSNVYPESSIFAAGFVLIVIVLLVNLSAKGILFYATAPSRGHRDTGLASLSGYLPARFRRKKPDDTIPCTYEETATLAAMDVYSGSDENSPSGIPSGPAPDPQPRPDDAATPIPSPARPPRNPLQLWEKVYPALTSIRQRLSSLREKIRLPVPGKKDTTKETHDTPQADREKSGSSIRHFLRTLIPFAIPAALLLVVAFLATIPPLHDILGPASPTLAGLFASGLSGIVTVAGLIFALLFAKRRGAFREKNRRTGYAAIATGFCLLCIAGIICSSAAAGLFNTGNDTAVQSSGDRDAKLAALIAADGGDTGQESTVSVQTVTPTTLTTPVPAAVPAQVVPGAVTTSMVPVKDALGVGEYYWYGDSEHLCRATVYGYKVLPFYFWWYLDYNRFVQQVPPPGDSYLVVFLRIEDLGTKSAIIPSADQIAVTNNGNSYSNEPFFNLSVLSQSQIDYFSNNLNDLPYQWIREIGQDKRDYSYLMGYNIFAANGGTAGNGTINNGILTSNVSESTSYMGAINQTQPQWGLGYWLLPGTSNAIDGYLIYDVPDSAVNTTEDLKSTYVQVSFNNISFTRWQLGTDLPA